MKIEEAITDYIVPAIKRTWNDKKCKEILEALEQEPKTGHWEWLTEDKYRCSNCNSETRVDECMNEPMYVFCPFCGAKMKSEDKE